MKYFILFLAIIFQERSNAQATIKINGKLVLDQPAKATEVLLRCGSDESFEVKAPIVDGSFELAVPIASAGIYNLRVANTMIELLLAPSERQITITGEISSTKNQLLASTAKETMAYQVLFKTIRDYTNKLSQQLADCKNLDSCDGTVRAILVSYHNDLDLIVNTYPATYAGHTLVPMLVPALKAAATSSSLDCYRKHYWDAVPLADSTLLNTPIYSSMINFYVGYLVPAMQGDHDALIDKVLTAVAPSPEMLHRTAAMLFDAMLDSGHERMLQHFIQWYARNQRVVNNRVLDSKLDKLAMVMPGMTAKPISLISTDGNNKSLSESIAAGKCTLLLFWSSECSHCREEMPSIKSLYQRYHSRGLEIYAVSLEQDKDKWLSYITKHNLLWTNVRNDFSLPINPAMEYVVLSTPAMILIDSKGKVVHRFVPKSKVEKYVSALLD